METSLVSDPSLVKLFLYARACGDGGAAAHLAARGLDEFGWLISIARDQCAVPIRSCLLNLLLAAAPWSLTDSAAIENFVVDSVWLCHRAGVPLGLLASLHASDVDRMADALGVEDGGRDPARVLHVLGWLLMHCIPSSRRNLVAKVEVTITQNVQQMLRGSPTRRAAALEFLADLGSLVPSHAWVARPLLMQAIKLDDIAVRELTVIAAFDMAFCLLFASPTLDQRSLDFVGELVKMLPRFIDGPSVNLQRASAHGMARLVNASLDDEFAGAMARCTADECICDKMIAMLATRLVDVRYLQRANLLALRPDENKEIVSMVDKALTALDDGLLADGVVFIVLNAMQRELLTFDEESGQRTPLMQPTTRRALTALLQKIESDQLKAELPMSIVSHCSELFGSVPDLGGVRSLLSAAENPALIRRPQRGEW